MFFSAPPDGLVVNDIMFQPDPLKVDSDWNVTASLELSQCYNNTL